MDNIGIDLHKNQSQICILTEEGEFIGKRVRTERNRFAEVLWRAFPFADSHRGFDGKRVDGFPGMTSVNYPSRSCCLIPKSNRS